MKKNQEVKISPCFTFTQVAIVPPDNDVPSTIYSITDSVLGQITQGSGQGQRVGNMIQISNFNVRGVLSCDVVPSQSNLTNAPSYVKFWFFRPRNCIDYATFNDTLSNFFQNGSASVGFSNTLIDLIRPINKDFFIIYETRKFKLGRSDADPSGNRLGNNDFKLSATFNVNLTKHLPKKIKFDDVTSNPVNTLIIWMAAIYNADGTLVSSTQPQNPYSNIKMSFDSYCSYRDD